MTCRIAVLASGGGSNFQALADYLEQRGADRCAQIVVVASDRPGAAVLERAAKRGIETRVLATPVNSRREPLDAVLRAFDVDLVVLAGYLRLVPESAVREWAGRIVNVHPALLPAFGGPGMYGSRVHQAVLSSGTAITGVTVHFVDAQYDRGAIIAQWPVPVLPNDDAPTLAARVLRVEHLLYPRVVDALASGRIGPGDKPRVSGDFVLAPHSDEALRDAIERSVDGRA